MYLCTCAQDAEKEGVASVIVFGKKCEECGGIFAKNVLHKKTETFIHYGSREKSTLLYCDACAPPWDARVYSVLTSDNPRYYREHVLCDRFGNIPHLPANFASYTVTPSNPAFVDEAMRLTGVSRATAKRWEDGGAIHPIAAYVLKREGLI